MPTYRMVEKKVVLSRMEQCALNGGDSTAGKQGQTQVLARAHTLEGRSPVSTVHCSSSATRAVPGIQEVFHKYSPPKEQTESSTDQYSIIFAKKQNKINSVNVITSTLTLNICLLLLS